MESMVKWCVGVIIAVTCSSVLMLLGSHLMGCAGWDTPAWISRVNETFAVLALSGVVSLSLLALVGFIKKPRTSN